MTTFMPGIDGAKNDVADHIRDEFPEYLRWERRLLSLQDNELRDPVRVLPHEPQALDKDLYPTIAVHGIRTVSIRRQELMEPQTIAYATTYLLRAFLWVCEDKWAPVIKARDVQAVMLRRFLLDRPTVVPERSVVQEDEMSEDYSDVTKVKGDRFVAGVYIDFKLLVEESLTLTAAGFRSPSGIVEDEQMPGAPPPSSMVQTTTVETTPIHPAFED